MTRLRASCYPICFTAIITMQF